ncbi:nitric oxide reductase transcription regulator [Bordetella genomosp. 1]|uniref:Nitric oxide reductase transcription regulator n=1 Tax=Bordetella genomosp. 1 TaxID=1395607 RepID=A0A261RVR3_9BORD|nr:nitric oxide reductase transcriptional regulator NorR [Bordetella genomosp. 1]MDQ8032228.1 nitric oxide reductase transcriptional regulator NorR [Bordetella sp.]OZI29169.1 nitric oxide reductase transcription regulator [Bordetella genomosp. 1]
MMTELLLADFTADLPAGVRLQRLVVSLRAHFRAGACALLRLDGDYLRPLAVDGLSSDALGRRFVVAQQPRLAAILARAGVTRFPADSGLPDPYDGLIDDRLHEPLSVHDCMGASLSVEGRQVGVLTLDALDAGTFLPDAQRELERLLPAIEAALRITRLEEEIRALRLARAKEPALHIVRGDEEIIGRSEAITHLLHELTVVADSELPVLLLGETGVGKELFAHRLHRLSRRRAKPLIHVNCAALPESLAESELFGHAKGAFSGATAERPGRFEAANGGTLFLDEVGELPLAIQAKLLRTLQNGEIQRLGSDIPRRVDVRVIAATNRNLREHVRDGTFRADLYHRLSVYPIAIPPLRERGDDVMLLAGRFLELNRARLGLRALRLAPEAEQALRRYAWPGNVRELEHEISRAALKVVSRGAGRNEIVTLPADLFDLDGAFDGESAAARADGGGRPAPGVAPPAISPATPLREAVDAFQRDWIRQALQARDGNWSQAARQLGLDPSNLHKLARRLGL